MARQKRSQEIKQLYRLTSRGMSGRRSRQNGSEQIRVNMGPAALETLIAHVRRGYEVPYKSEVGGHLLGFFSKDDGLIHIKQVVPYRTPCAARTYFAPNFEAFERKGKLLRQGQKRWVGVYHSHPETGGRASALPSPEDMKSHREASIPLEMVVRVTPYHMHSPRVSLSASCGSYFYDISCFVKDEENRIMPASEIVVN